MSRITVTYDDTISRRFVTASMVWGIVAMLAGVVAALQLAFWPANLSPEISFGRLRPLHTNAAIFAFVGNMIFAGVYYSTQRLLKARMASDFLSGFNFWGWQAIIVAAAITLPLGHTQAKEYAELEWPIDIAIAVVWVAFAINFFWTVAKRNESHLYVALWFYISTIVTVAILHIVNSLSIPVTGLKSYSVFGGVQDALVQWWYGHNAVAFFLTTPILGIMYYFVPKAAERPVFSYRLSIIHFWSLIFIYIWAGPHHLLNTALPDWAQTLGMIFSLMLLAPSWGGMLNGLLTLRGAWDKLRSDPVLKFFAAGITFYGMATFEGPLLSIKGVSSLAHYTDWIIAHVHGGALGWNGLMAAGMFYWMVPRLYGTELFSRRLANFHFYIGTFGILLYVVSMWTSGVTQGLMWRAENDQGGLLYPNFVETLLAIRGLYWTRFVGGVLYLTGYILQAYNLWKTAKQGSPQETSVEVTPADLGEGLGAGLIVGKPVILSMVALLVLSAIAFTDAVGSTAIMVGAVLITALGSIFLASSGKKGGPSFHHRLEGRLLPFTALSIVAVLIGGAAEIIPSVVTGTEALAQTQNHPYTPLQLEGRDVFIREGCYNCHSQMIRPFTWETARYGAPSLADETIYDHPFQWGSKRTGPDLARVGGKYSNLWHYEHLVNPREISPGSNMPNYPHLAEENLDFQGTADKLRVMRTVGVPYSPEDIARASADALAQGNSIAHELKEQGNVTVPANSRMVAIIAYLQRLGQIPEPEASADSTPSPTSTEHAVAASPQRTVNP